MHKSGTPIKKIMLAVLTVLLMVCICACGSSPAPGETALPVDTTAAPAPETTSATEAPATIPPTTESPTEVTTEPVTEPPTDPTTEPVTEAETEPTEDQGKDYVLNTNSHKFHYPSCSSVDSMKDSNKAFFHGTREEVIAKGYDPCGRCHP